MKQVTIHFRQNNKVVVKPGAMPNAHLFEVSHSDAESKDLSNDIGIALEGSSLCCK